MKDKLSLADMLRGYVRVWNEAGDVVEAKNLVVYTGGDILAALLGGQAEYRISNFYFEYENTAGVPAPPAAARTDTVALFLGLTAPQDFISAPILLPPQYSTSDVNHVANQVTFLSVANAVAGYHGVPFGAANNSKVYGLGLVASPTGVTTGDVLYAHFILPTALPAAGSGQISATWMTEAN
jgi:hypothetical protein